MSHSLTFKINPPLLNSACPWATTIEDIQDLYNCPYTGATTIRTSLLNGFGHDPTVHQYTFFSPSVGFSTAVISKDGRGEAGRNESSSFNTLGYSPIILDRYLDLLASAAKGEMSHLHLRNDKPIILSVAGRPEAVAECYKRISDVQDLYPQINLMMEINLSCPNILDEPPPAYNAGSLVEYLTALALVRGERPVLTGIKTPPYTYQVQYNELLSALEASVELPGGCPLSFISATNTVGSCLVMNNNGTPALSSASGDGLGGMAGSALHPLALGNVATIRKMLDARESLKHIAIIGIGGVSDMAGYQRMKSVGAAAVAVASALGREGVAIFEKISQGNE